MTREMSMPSTSSPSFSIALLTAVVAFSSNASRTAASGVAPTPLCVTRDVPRADDAEGRDLGLRLACCDAQRVVRLVRAINSNHDRAHTPPFVRRCRLRDSTPLGLPCDSRRHRYDAWDALDELGDELCLELRLDRSLELDLAVSHRHADAVG